MQEKKKMETAMFFGPPKPHYGMGQDHKNLRSKSKLHLMLFDHIATILTISSKYGSEISSGSIVLTQTIVSVERLE
ncbi:hypothetical protein llap_943 [Limosa lapponica baueri]|uniref:Uncharacterized protein n=1 Tax=Limosa lapponica baueri TaxID=1758121 RepID=A0A2I0URU5_LIMLA|nr:hypothetical protein llap_943 [Limosa lapponica baueri]